MIFLAKTIFVFIANKCREDVFRYKRNLPEAINIDKQSYPITNTAKQLTSKIQSPNISHEIPLITNDIFNDSIR